MKHTGGCHCRKVRYEVEMTIKNGITCNCSICLKRGSVLDFVPEPSFKLVSGQNDLKEYTFNQHKIRHHFCTTCGILPFARAKAPDGTPMYAINLRSVDDIDLAKVQIQEYDGRSL